MPPPTHSHAHPAGEMRALTALVDVENAGTFKNCFAVKDLDLKPDHEFFGVTVADYGSDVDLHSFVGINISVKPPATGSPDQDMIKVLRSPLWFSL